MLVKDRMTLNPVTVSPDTSVSEALNLMRQRKVRRMPVVDKHGHLVGIVAEKDLLYASPSPATSLNVYEIGYLLSKLKVKEIMARDIVTVTEDAPLEEAARIMVDSSVSGLPVVRDRNVVGIITETDIFKILLEMMGARNLGTRLTIQVHDQPGTLSRIAGTIAGIGGDIVALGTFRGEGHGHSLLVIKVCCIEQDALVEAMRGQGFEIVDVRAA
ncbi:MAG: CBS and ACT domain-containing protein [Anaerolineae bacterium]|nr:CBS and ACT domain-containing protein [Anaerolineae bacterium]